MPDKRWPAQQGTAPEATVRALTRELASYAARSRFQDLPETIRIEAARAFLNWVGCVLGGCREPAVAIAAETAATLGGGPQATMFAHQCAQFPPKQRESGGCLLYTLKDSIKPFSHGEPQRR